MTLENNQVLIIDNKRMLHGRSSIKGERILNRLWIFDEERSDKLICPYREDNYYESETKKEVEQLEIFNHFLPLIEEREIPLKFKTGIRIPNQMAMYIDECIYN